MTNAYDNNMNTMKDDERCFKPVTLRSILCFMRELFR